MNSDWSNVSTPMMSTGVNMETTLEPGEPMLPEDPITEPRQEDNYYFKAAELGIPFALTSAIIIVLCVTIIYTRYRRSQLRQSGRSVRPTRSIHGVPLSSSMRDNITHVSGPPGYTAPSPLYHPMHVYPSDGPPRYEDIIKDPPVIQPGGSQYVQTSFTQGLSEESTQTSDNPAVASQPTSNPNVVTSQTSQNPTAVTSHTAAPGVASQTSADSTDKGPRDSSLTNQNNAQSHMASTQSTGHVSTSPAQSGGHVNASFARTDSDNGGTRETVHL